MNKRQRLIIAAAIFGLARLVHAILINDWPWAEKFTAMGLLALTVAFVLAMISAGVE